MNVVRKSITERYDVHVGMNWAVFCISEDGAFQVLSSYGNYAYFWSHHGRESFKHFLIELQEKGEYSYAINKLAQGDDRDVFMHGATVDAIKTNIIESRRGGDINKEHAREMYNYTKEVLEDVHDLNMFIHSLYEFNPFAVFYEDYDSIPISKEHSPALQRFMKEVFPVLVEELKKEIQGKEIVSSKL